MVRHVGPGQGLVTNVSRKKDEQADNARDLY
jgi:hypothetical protein